MKIAVLEKLNQDLVIHEMEPGELTSGQVLVKVLVSGLCGSQLQEISGNKGNSKFLPHPLGHEGCGIVKAIGPNVTKVNPGDKVVMHWRPGSGIESDFPIYMTNSGSISGGKVTTLSEYSIVSENRITKVAQDTPPELAPLLGCSLSTAYSSVFHELNIDTSEKVLILGGGGLGLAFAYVLKKLYGVEITVFEKNTSKFDLILNLNVDNVESQTINLNKSYNHIIDTCGSPELFTEIFELVAPGGNYVLVGQPKPGQKLTIPNANRLFEGSGKKIMATQGGGFNPDSDIPKIIEIERRSEYDFSKLISHRFAFLEINEAFSLLSEGQAGRIMIQIGDLSSDKS